MYVLGLEGENMVNIEMMVCLNRTLLHLVRGNVYMYMLIINKYQIIHIPYIHMHTEHM